MFELAELEGRRKGCFGELAATLRELEARRDSGVFRPGVFGAEDIGLCASVVVAMPIDMCRAGCDKLFVLTEMLFRFGGSSWPVSGTVGASMAAKVSSE